MSILFENKNFRLLLLGRMVSDIGSSIQMLIMPLYIIDIGGSASTIGLYSFLSLIPIILVYPFGGVIGDRLNRKKIMVSTDLISGLLVLSLAIASYMGFMSIALLLVIQSLVALMYGFFDPATKGMVPSIVEKDNLNKANSMVATLRIISGIASPLVAIGLYTTFGVAVLFLINGISFILSSISEQLIRYEHHSKEIAWSPKSVMEDLLTGVRFILNSSTIRRLCLYFLALFAMIQPIFAMVLPLIFRKQLNYSDSIYGYIQIALLTGALLGSIIIGKYGKKEDLKKPMFMGIGVLIISIFTFSTLTYPGFISMFESGSLLYLVIFTAVLFIMYTSIMIINIPVQTIIQSKTPKEYMSRVFSIVGMISKGGMPFGALIYGLLLDRIEVSIVLATVSCMVLIISYILFKKEGS